MSNPSQRAIISGYSETRPSDVNQLLGSPVVTPIFDGTGIYQTTGLYAYWFPLTTNGSIDQPWKFFTGTNELDRVEIPIQMIGNGADIIISLYNDNAGIPTGAPIASTFVPKEYSLATSNFARWNMGVLGDGQKATPNNLTPPIPQGGSYFDYGIASNEDYTILVGGWNGTTAISNVWSAQGITPTETSMAGVTQWVQQPSYPQPIYQEACAIFSIGTQSYIFCVGGGNSSTTVTASTYIATIDDVGNISGWAAGPTLPVQLFGMFLGVVPNSDGTGVTIYAIGGLDNTIHAVNTVYSTSWVNGALSAWTTTTVFPTVVCSNYYTTPAIVINNFLVVAGGYLTSVAATNQVWAARINPDQTLQPWIPWPSLPVTATSGAFFVDGNCLYYFGGNTPSLYQLQSFTLAVDTYGPAPSWISGPSLSSGGYDIGGGGVLVGQPSIFYHNQFGGIALAIWQIAYISVPLVGALVNNTVYHIVVTQTNADDHNYAEVLLMTEGQELLTADTVRAAQVGSGTTWILPRNTDLGLAWPPPNYVYSGSDVFPMKMYNGKAGRLLHTIQDSGVMWDMLAYDYWGKPNQYFKSIQPTINLLSTNISTFGTGLPSTTSGWPTTANTTLSVVNIDTGSLYPPLGPHAVKMSGEQTFPDIASPFFMYGMQLSSIAAGDMSTDCTATSSAFPIIEPGVHYTAFAYFQAETFAHVRSVQTRINWFQTDGTFISNTNGTSVVENDFGRLLPWTQAFVTGIAPGNATRASIRLTVFGTGGAAEKHYVACIQLAPTSQFPLTYFVPGIGPTLIDSCSLNYAADGSLSSITTI